MGKQKFIITTAAVLVMCLLVSGYAAVAAGSTDDPLVTQSYVEQVLTPKALTAAEDAANAAAGSYTATINARLSSLTAEIEQRLAVLSTALASDEAFVRQVAAQSGVETGSTWTSETLSAGQKLYLAAGANLVLRSGGATCIESGGSGLIDLTEVSSLSDGEELTLYSLYTTTTQSAGLTATERTKVLISGDYTIG